MKNKMMGRAIAVIAIAIVILLCSIFALNNYEKGLLDVCAVSQDNYVRLVYKQIELEKDRSDDEIINNILGTLNSSSSRYWTFAKGESILFIKDVFETDRYKSVTAKSYFVSDSAQKFLVSLKRGRLHHDMIEMNGKDYIASGTIFEYNGNEYELCLLTNKSVFLSNNLFLSCKIELIILIVLLDIALVVVTLHFMLKREKYKDNLDDILRENKYLLDKVESLNHELEVREIYDPRLNQFSASVIDAFEKRLVLRPYVFPITYVRFLILSEKGEEQLYDDVNFVYKKKALKFKDEEKQEIIIMLLMTEGIGDAFGELIKANTNVKLVSSRCYRSVEDYGQ